MNEIKPVCVVESPAFTRSGYGGLSEDIIKSLNRYNKFDLKIVPTRWGACSKKNLLADVKSDPELSSLIPLILTQPLTKQPEIYIKISIPSEFNPVGKYNIGITAGIESTISSPTWLEGLNRMDYNFATSKFARDVFRMSSFTKNYNDGRKEDVKLQKPCDVLFWGANTSIFHKTDVKNDHLESFMKDIKEDFAFLFVGQWTSNSITADRKNIGMLIKTFIETFRKFPKDKKPCLILKTSGPTLSNIDKYECISKLKSIISWVGDSPDNPNVYILHGELSSEEMNALYNHEKIKSNINFTHGEGFCVLKDTKIITNNGLKNIQDITTNDSVLTHTGKYKKVISPLSRKYTGDMYEIKTTNGFNIHPITLTPNHNVYVYENNNFVWKRTDELKKNDSLCIPITKNDVNLKTINLLDYIIDKNLRLNESKFIEYIHSNNSPKNTPILNSQNLDKDFGKLMGYYLAEGSISKSSTITFSIHEDEINTIGKELIEIFRNKFNISHYRITRFKNKKCICLHFHSTIISKFLLSFCGKLSYGKFIQNDLFNFNNEFKSGLLTSLFVGDGHFALYNKNNPNIGLDICNKNIIENIRLILLTDFDIISHIDCKNRIGNISKRGIITKHKSYRLRISQVDNVIKFFDITKKNHSFINDENNVVSKKRRENYIGGNSSYIKKINGIKYFITKIKSIEKINHDGNVYNLSIENDESYCTENFCVHNCKPLLEATLSGKPVLVSNWSGHLDFLDENLCKLLPGEVKQIPPDAVNDYFLKESGWFEVNYQAASEIMKNVVNHYEPYLQNAEKLRIQNESKFSLQEMDKVFFPILDKIIPQFAIQQQIILPKLKKITLPKLNT